MTDYEKIVEELSRALAWHRYKDSPEQKDRILARQILSTQVGTHRVAVVDEGAELPINPHEDVFYKEIHKSAQQDMILANWRKVVSE